MLDRKRSVHWYDVDSDTVIEVSFERRRIRNGVVRDRLDKNFPMDPPDGVAEWHVYQLLGEAPFQRTLLNTANPLAAALHIQTAIGLMLFQIIDRLPEPGYRIVSEREDD